MRAPASLDPCQLVRRQLRFTIKSISHQRPTLGSTLGIQACELRRNDLRWPGKPVMPKEHRRPNVRMARPLRAAAERQEGRRRGRAARSRPRRTSRVRQPPANPHLMSNFSVLSENDSPAGKAISGPLQITSIASKAGSPLRLPAIIASSVSL